MAKAFKSKFTYFMRTIDEFEEYVEPIGDLLTEVSFQPFLTQTQLLIKISWNCSLFRQRMADWESHVFVGTLLFSLKPQNRSQKPMLIQFSCNQNR